MKDYLIVIGQILLILLGFAVFGAAFIGLPLYFGGRYAAIFYGVVLGGSGVAIAVAGIREEVRQRRWDRRWSETLDRRHHK